LIWLVVLVLMLPLLVAFEMDNLGVRSITWMQTVWFMLDLIFNFLTTYMDDTGLISSHKEILVEYMKSWFIIDFISAMPVEEAISVNSIRGTAIGHGFKILKMVKLLRLFKIERNQFLAKIQRKYQIKYSTISLVKFLILLILGAHWLGCLFYSVSIVSGCDQPYCSWVVAQAESRHFFSPIDGQCFNDECGDWSVGSRYLTSLYWAMTTMSTIGYGDITPKNEVEQLFALFGMLCGSVAFAYGLTNLCSILFYYKQYEVDFEASFDQLFEFFSRHQTPLELRLKIQEFLSWKYHQDACEFNGATSIDTIFEPLTETLKNDLMSSTINQAFPEHVEHNKYLLFNTLGEGRFKSLMCGKMETLAFSKGDIISSIIPSLNTVGNSVVYVARGSVIWNSKSDWHLLQEGYSYNEYRLLENDKEGCKVNAVAHTNCMLAVIETKHLKEVLAGWPLVEKEYYDFLENRRAQSHPDYIDPDEDALRSVLVDLQNAAAKEAEMRRKGAEKLKDDHDIKNSNIRSANIYDLEDGEDKKSPQVETSSQARPLGLRVSPSREKGDSSVDKPSPPKKPLSFGSGEVKSVDAPPTRATSLLEENSVKGLIPVEKPKGTNNETNFRMRNLSGDSKAAN